MNIVTGAILVESKTARETQLAQIDELTFHGIFFR